MLQQNVILDTTLSCYKPPNMLKIVITVMYDVMGLVRVDIADADKQSML